jgi:beta-barrel assembly-enhancing protease
MIHPARFRLVVVSVVWMIGGAAGGAISLISVDQEVQIGRQANAQVHKQVPEFRDAQVAGYVASIGRRLVRVAPGARYPYSFEIADYQEINAFALPGGPVWIHRGVIHAATNESQLAGVMAHEIAHIAQRHAADQLTKAVVKNFGLNILGAFLGNSGGAGAAQIAAGFLSNGIFLKFSRDDEREADRVGLQIMTRAGWDARGMTELFQTLQREAKRNPSSVETFFSTHPSPADRISRLRADVARYRGGTRDTRQFQNMRARSLRLPPPRQMPRN